MIPFKDKLLMLDFLWKGGKMWKCEARKTGTEAHLLGSIEGTDYDIYLGDTFDSEGIHSWKRSERLFHHANLIVSWLNKSETLERTEY